MVRFILTETRVSHEKFGLNLALNYLLITGQVPNKKVLVSTSKIKKWICDLNAMDQNVEIKRFWELREQFPWLKINVNHDASGRRDGALGSQSHLTQHFGSYFDPEKMMCIPVILGMRFCHGFCVGGCADESARALCVTLGTSGGWKLVRISRGISGSFAAEKADKNQPDGVATIASDNTDSALNVKDYFNGYTRMECIGWPCPIHINAIMLSNPLNAAFGKHDPSFQEPHPLNLCKPATHSGTALIDTKELPVSSGQGVSWP